MLVDFSEIEAKERYKLMSGGIIPRPIAWIVTENKKGVINVAPFSYFTGLSSNPPTLIVSIGHKSSGEPKDTLKNIRESKKCTLCLTKEEQLEPMHFSSKELESGISEAVYFDIPTKKIVEDFPPIISEVPLAFFCTLYKEVELKGSKTIPLILEIKSEYIDESAIDKDLRTDFSAIARLGGEYAFLSSKITPPKIEDKNE